MRVLSLIAILCVCAFVESAGACAAKANRQGLFGRRQTVNVVVAVPTQAIPMAAPKAAQPRPQSAVCENGSCSVPQQATSKTTIRERVRIFQR